MESRSSGQPNTGAPTLQIPSLHELGAWQAHWGEQALPTPHRGLHLPSVSHWGVPAGQVQPREQSGGVPTQTRGCKKERGRHLGMVVGMECIGQVQQIGQLGGVPTQTRGGKTKGQGSGGSWSGGFVLSSCPTAPSPPPPSLLCFRQPSPPPYHAWPHPATQPQTNTPCRTWQMLFTQTGTSLAQAHEALQVPSAGQLGCRG